jgi:hypothetical protein
MDRDSANANEDQRKQLRTIMKQQLSEYITLDDKIASDNKKLLELKKQRGTYEKSLEEIGEVINLENEKLKYHGEIIKFDYNSQKPCLSNGLIKTSVLNYLNSTNEWRKLPAQDVSDTLIDKINQQKDIQAGDKKKNLKIKRVRNKT